MHRCTNKLGFAILERLGIIFLVVLCVLILISSDKSDPDPTENAGKVIDKAALSVGQQLEKTSINVQEAGKAEKF